MNIIRESLHIRGGGRRRTAGLSEKKGLGRVRKLRAFSLSHDGIVVKAVVLKAYKERESIPTLGPSLLNNLKVSWLKSERKGFGKIEKSRWCSGARSLQGEDRFPAWPRASSFTLLSEWKKPIR